MTRAEWREFIWMLSQLSVEDKQEFRSFLLALHDKNTSEREQKVG